MPRGLHLAMLLPIASLIGCAVSGTPSSTAPTGSWTNWQIQSGNVITSPPAGLYFAGALQNQGTQVTGIFTTNGFNAPVPGTGTQVLPFTGSVATTGAYALASTAYDLGFTASSNPSTSTPVSVIGGCIGAGSGPVCTAIFLVQSEGVEIAPLTGTYTGTLTNASSPSGGVVATLTLTQSATPNSSGQFPLSGQITFPSSSDIGTAPLGGTVTGEGIALSDSSTAPNSPTANITAAASPDATQITISSLLYSNAGPGAVFVYTGTLTRQ